MAILSITSIVTECIELKGGNIEATYSLGQFIDRQMEEIAMSGQRLARLKFDISSDEWNAYVKATQDMNAPKRAR